MFEKARKIVELQNQKQYLENRLKTSEEDNATLLRDRTKLIEDQERAIVALRSDLESQLRIKTSELDHEIRVKTSRQEDVIRDLKIEVATAKKEVEVYHKAFLNMGMDVKSMNEILVKLVDGIASKNSVNVIKS